MEHSKRELKELNRLADEGKIKFYDDGHGGSIVTATPKASTKDIDHANRQIDAIERRGVHVSLDDV